MISRFQSVAKPELAERVRSNLSSVGLETLTTP